MRTLFLTIMTLTAGCLACTEIGCVGSLELTFDTPTEDGAYTVEVDLGDRVETCAFTTVALSDTGSPLEGDCATTIADGTITLALWTLSGAEQPEDIHVALLQDAVVLDETTVRPAWSEPLYPNGKRCGGACVGGTAAVTFDI